MARPVASSTPLVEPELVQSWLLSLRAERKSPQTLKVYGDGVARFISWCAGEGIPPALDRATVGAFIAGLLDAGAEASTARSRQLAVRRFASWMVDEGETTADLLAGMKPPKLDVKVIPSLTDADLKALLAACSGTEMRDRRDTALIRFMAETGARAGEVVALTMTDVDIRTGLAIVRRGKGGKGRSVPFGAKTGQAIDRYIRARRTHVLADTPPLWLGDRGKLFSYDALHKTLTMRARLAGLEGFHPHVLRHTAASRWLAAGGSEGGLMAIAGWTRRDMLDRYTAATASDRAAAEARDLGLGDL